MRNKFLGTGTPGLHPIRKLAVILSGLRIAVLYDLSVAWKLGVSLLVLVVSFVLREWVDFLLLLVATSQMIIAEVLNTTIELLCDLVEPNYDLKIKATKDVAAAAAGIGIFVWVCAVVYEAVRLSSLFLPGD